MKKVYKKISTEDIKNMESPWTVIEPIFWTVNIYDSYEKYLKSAENFTLEQRFANSIHWYFSEVFNGGHDQFFGNSTGIVWEDAMNGFRLFGMNEYADNFQELLDFLGNDIPFDRDERNDLLADKMDEDEDLYFDIFDKHDNFVFDLDKVQQLQEYIIAHPDKFTFDGEYNML